MPKTEQAGRADHSGTTVRKRFLALDSWRGLCALWIAAYHFRVVSDLSASHFVRSGVLAVDFFFVLSGFVIWHGFGKQMATGMARIQFLIRRFGRLYPLHLATLGLVVAMEAARWTAVQVLGRPIGPPPFSGDTSLETLPANLLLVHGLGIFPKFSWNVPSWSISVEFAVCFLFVLAMLTKRPVVVAAALAALAAAILQTILWTVPHVPEAHTALARGVYGFFLGILCYALYDRFRDWRPSLWHELLAFPAIILASYTSMMVTTLVFAYVVFIFAYEGSAISRFLKHSALVRCGDLSYSIYLLHFPMVLIAFAVAAMAGFMVPLHGTVYIDAGSPWIGDVLQLLFLLTVVGVARLSYAWIEMPARTFFNGVADRYAKRREQKTAELASSRPGA